MRPRGLIAAAVGAAVVAGSLWWILHAVLSLEAGERQARLHAAREERARLALWRMDSALSTFLAFENATPVDPPPGYGGEAPPMLAGRFEVAADQDAASLPAASQLVALLGQPPLDPGPPPPPPPQSTPPRSPPPPSPPQKLQPEPDRLVTPPTPSVREEALDPSQAAFNSAEFVQRSRVAGQQATLVMPIEPPPAEGGAISNTDERQTDETSESDEATSPPPPPPPAAPPPARATGPAGPTGIVRPLEPLWLEGKLVLVRRIVRTGSEALQGLELDDAATRAWLLDQVQDLLPNSRLEPVRASDPADPGRQLALLPFRLVPGAPPEIGDAATSSARLGVLLALASLALVALAAGALVFAGLRLARRRSDFASAVIHELRTPLTTFRLYTDMLAEGAVPPSEQPRYLETLRRESDRLGHLVENVLAYARLEPRRRPDVAPLQLAAWLREAALRLEEQASHKGLTLKLTIAPEAETVYVAAEPLSLERILHNLCDNSCKYAADSEHLELALTLRKRHAILTWRDHGPGIPRRARRRLLRPFQRGVDTGQQEVDGIGLGLALCQQLARRLGGKLRLIDQDGDGVEVELSLPRVNTPTPSATPPSDRPV